MAAQTERNVDDRESGRQKSEFFSLLSHELRTPLTAIIGYTELLTECERDQLSKRAQEFLDAVQRNTERLDRLIRDVLLVAQIDAGTFALQPGEVDASELAARCESEMRAAAERSVLEFGLEAAKVPSFGGDAEHLQQAMEQLVLNAIKFTPPGGRVDVRIRAENRSCVIEIADTGVGIEPEGLAKLFDRFYRSRTADSQHVQGAGLGLAITKAIVDAHGGSIAVESEVGKGSTFRIVLPMRPCGQKSSKRRQARSRPSGSRKRPIAEVRR
jgi:signal transduction histidine kinase